MGHRLDEIDRLILHALMSDARGTSAPMIADEVSVSPGTIRNRIRQLEEYGVITGYHANVDFEQTGHRFTNLFVCTAPVPERERLSKLVREISGVVNIRELLSGRGNLHVLAVGADMNDVTRIGRELSNLGLEIEDENLVRRESFEPYSPFGPNERPGFGSLADVVSLAGGSEVVELVVAGDASIVGKTLGEVGDDDLLDDDVLVVSIERDDDVLTPRGRTAIEPDDVVTLLSRRGVGEDTIQLFSSPDESASTDD
ncbi:MULTISPECIES: Lrp/AsnC family transcriptional regulator [Haloferax]|uniref:AsnC family transcriptional regulator n=2 Tax=Haloferax TaxID=2251 RepID=A0A6G1Z3H2_9EURY|nr:MULTISPECIES: Lrp/AsnC family transcriptional regulator [Haloferax]KAB1188364.1 AsnC family transcriptional regulator [Haloferax sp. CBA1149]MRW81053.1 AsnC family transcriptional regulator [Haloferax marinisediminis]